MRMIKSRFCKKATKIWPNLPVDLEYLAWGVLALFHMALKTCFYCPRHEPLLVHALGHWCLSKNSHSVIFLSFSSFTFKTPWLILEFLSISRIKKCSCATRNLFSTTIFPDLYGLNIPIIPRFLHIF